MPEEDNILLQSSWGDYEEGCQTTIFEKNGTLFIRSEGHNVYCGDYDNVCEISQEEALETMLEEEENEDGIN